MHTHPFFCSEHPNKRSTTHFRYAYAHNWVNEPKKTSLGRVVLNLVSTHFKKRTGLKRKSHTEVIILMVSLKDFGFQYIAADLIV